MTEKPDIIGKKVIFFIKEIIKKNVDVDNIIEVGNSELVEETKELDGEKIETTCSTRGFIYERLWDLCIKFGVVDELTMKPINEKELKLMTTHIFGNPNSKDVIFNDDCWKGEFNKYLEEKIQSGNTGGYSDITFINKTNLKEPTSEELCFVSVKYFEKEKGIDKYDIGKLCTLVEKHKRTGRTIKLMIFVNNKKDVIEKLKALQPGCSFVADRLQPPGLHIEGDSPRHDRLPRRLHPRQDALPHVGPEATAGLRGGRRHGRHVQQGLQVATHLRPLRQQRRLHTTCC